MTLSPVKTDSSLSPSAFEAHQEAPQHLKTILKTLPPECFQKNSLKAWTSVLINVVAVTVGYVGLVYAPWFLLPIAWIFTGTALTGWFVLAHDCGHRSFSNRKWVNNWVGHLMTMPLIYPFHSWRILHNKHHKHTNKLEVDNAWQPFQSEFYDSVGSWGQLGYRMLRGWFWWVASIVHWSGLHFNLDNFAPQDHKAVKRSIASVLLFAGIVFPLLIATTGPWGFVKFWLLPWLVYHFWMSTFTLVHHTDSAIPFTPAPQWNAAIAQLAGTVHCRYPFWVEILCHDINVHIPHHLSTAIPSYNLRLAHQSLKANWGTYLIERRFSLAMMRNIVDQCHLYDPEQCYKSFQDHHHDRRTEV